MIITIHQPDFIPWLGFFDRWRHSDLFIILDDVQFIRRGWQNRDKIKTPHGVQWLTIPVKTKGRYLQSINTVEIDDAWDWPDKHLALIRQSYAKAPGFALLYPELEKIYRADYKTLIDINMAFLRLFAKLMNITTPTVFSSIQRVEGVRSSRLVNLVKNNGGTAYLTGQGSREYLDQNLFEANGIQVVWQAFEHPHYAQLHGDFVFGLSGLDFLMMQPNGSIS